MVPLRDGLSVQVLDEYNQKFEVLRTQLRESGDNRGLSRLYERVDRLYVGYLTGQRMSDDGPGDSAIGVAESDRTDPATQAALWRDIAALHLYVLDSGADEATRDAADRASDAARQAFSQNVPSHWAKWAASQPVGNRTADSVDEFVASPKQWQQFVRSADAEWRVWRSGLSGADALHVTGAGGLPKDKDGTPFVPATGHIEPRSLSHYALDATPERMYADLRSEAKQILNTQIEQSGRAPSEWTPNRAMQHRRGQSNWRDFMSSLPFKDSPIWMIYLANTGGWQWH